MLEKFKKVMKKEVLYYSLTLVVLALIFHIDLISSPIDRLNLMAEKENYFHPFFYTVIVYGVLFILRKAIDLIANLFKKSTD